MGSGLERLGRAMSQAEADLGIVSVQCDPFDEATWAMAVDADVHVCHVHLPPQVTKRLAKPPKVVWVGHGTPEYTFAQSVTASRETRYGATDPFMLMQHWLQVADARVTFWPRHQAIYQTMVDKGTTVHCVPMGVDRRFWTPGPSRGKWGGAPSIFTAENSHRGKWPLDALLLWPWVAARHDAATLHVSCLAQDQHRWWFPLVNRNGAHFRAHLTDIKWGPDDLRNVFRSTDFFLGLVEYGDHNHLSMQAAATGVPTISYRGNVYADYWLTQGDQRVMADELSAILAGDVAPRAKESVPDIQDTAKAMVEIYEAIA